MYMHVHLCPYLAFPVSVCVCVFCLDFVRKRKRGRYKGQKPPSPIYISFCQRHTYTHTHLYMYTFSPSCLFLCMCECVCAVGRSSFPTQEEDTRYKGTQPPSLHPPFATMVYKPSHTRTQTFTHYANFFPLLDCAGMCVCVSTPLGKEEAR